MAIGEMVVSTERKEAPLQIWNVEADDGFEFSFNETTHTDACQRFKEHGYSVSFKRSCPFKDANVPQTRGRMIYFLLRVQAATSVQRHSVSSEKWDEL